MKWEVEARIFEVATRQHGVVTRSQLLEAGLSAAAITRRLDAGGLRALFRGVYLVGPVEPQFAREAAAVLACGPGAVLSHGGARRMWGLEPHGTSPRRMDQRDAGTAGRRDPSARDPVGRVRSTDGRSTDGSVRRSKGDSLGGASRFGRIAAGTRAHVELDVTTDGPHRGRRPGIRLHRSRLDPDERAIRQDIPVTSVGRTLLDLAVVLGRRELEVAVAQAERGELITRAALESLLERYRGRTGTRALRAILEFAGGPALTRSEAESRFLELVRRADLPVPQANVGIGPYEVDSSGATPGLRSRSTDSGIIRGGRASRVTGEEMRGWRRKASL